MTISNYHQLRLVYKILHHIKELMNSIHGGNDVNYRK